MIMDLVVNKGGVIEPGSYNKVICKGSARAKGDVEAKEILCKGTLDVQGNLTAHKIEVKGLKVREVRADELKTGFLDAGNVIVVHLEAKDKVKARNLLSLNDGLIGGSASCLALKVKEVTVRGSLSTIKADAIEMHVSGSIEVEKGSIRSIDVGGSAKIGNCKISRIRVGGTLRVLGKSEIEEGEASMVNIKGKLKGQSLRVMEVLTVEGSADIGKLLVGGTVKVKGRLIVGEADIWGGALGKVEGKSIIIRREAAEVKGDKITLISAKVGRAYGKIVRIDSSEVGTVEASEVEVKGRSRVKQITADRAYIIGGYVSKVYYKEKLLASPEAKIEKAKKFSLMNDLTHQ